MWYEHDGAHEGHGMEGAAEVDSQWAGARSAALPTVTLGSKARSRHPTARNLLTRRVRLGTPMLGGDSGTAYLVQHGVHGARPASARGALCIE